MCCGVRYAVVFLIFIGYLVSIGSREVFTIVIINVISNKTNTQSNFWGLQCTGGRVNDIHQPWPDSWRFYTQTGYFIGNLLTQIPGGLLAVRFSATRVSGMCILVSSALWFVMYFALQNDWSVLMFALRAIQGLLEGVVVPSFNGVLVAWAPQAEKSTMVTVSYAGAYLSPAVAAVVTGATLCVVNTMTPLFIYGGLGIVWSLIWLCCVYDSPTACPCLGARERALYTVNERRSHGNPVQFSEVPWKKILTSLPVWAIVVAAFCRNWIFSLLITQVPTYFHDVYNMGSLKQGIFSSIPHICMTVVVISVGFSVDMLIRRGILSTTVARKTAETIGFGVEASCLFTLGFIKNEGNEKLAVILLCVGVAVSGFAISGYQVNQLDLAPRYCAVITGIVRLGVIGSVLCTSVAGKLVNDKTGSKESIEQGWKRVFILAGSLHMAGVLFYLIFASGKRQSWAQPDEDFAVSVNRAEVDEAGPEPTERDGLIKPRGFENSFSRSMNFEHGDTEDMEDSCWLQSGVFG